MWGLRTFVRSGVERTALDIQRAGSAWACPFSSSAEFEAAIIQAKRQAGAYGPQRVRRQLCTAAAIAAAALLAACVLVLAPGGLR